MKYKSIMAPDGGINKYKPWNLIKDTEWSDAINMTFGNGYAKKVVGWTKFMPTQLDSRIYGIDNYFKSNGDSYLMFSTKNKLYYYSEETGLPVDITGANNLNGADNMNIITENIQDMFLYTNERCPIMAWDNSQLAAYQLGGLNECETGVFGNYIAVSSAKTMLNFNNFLILGNTTEGGTHFPQRIRWSTLGDATLWHNDADGNGQAGYLDISDGVDWVIGMRPLGNYIIIYKERSIHALSYVGGDLIFDRRPVVIGTGLLAPKAIIDLGTEHIFIGPDNIYSFDTIEPKIAGDNISKEFFRILKPEMSKTINAFFIEEVPEAWFTFVSIYSDNNIPDMALVYNTDTKAWSIREIPMTAYGYYTLQEDKTIDSIEDQIDSVDFEFDSSTNLANSPLNICGDSNGYIYILGGASKDGGNINCFIRSKLFDFGRPDIIKRLQRIQLMVSHEGEYNLNVKIGVVDNVEDGVTWYGPYTMQLSRTKPPWIDIDISGRFLCIEFGTQNKNESFKLTGYMLGYQERGIM